MAIAPPTYTPSGSLFGSAAPSTPTYTYGNLGNTTSDYSLWGSRGNPYTVAGPTYTPGSGLPINPQPIAPIAPPSNGGSDGDYVPPTTGGSDNGGFWGEDSQGWGDLTIADKALLGPISLYGDFAYGRIDVPGGGYARLPWYEGSAGNGYGYTEEGYDQYAPGDSDRGIYDASTGERVWGDEFNDYNTGDLWAETGVFEGIGNIFGGRTWDGLEEPATFGDPMSALSQEATKLQIEEKAQKAANRQAIADAEQAKLDAEQAKWDAQYAQINDLNTQQVGLMNDIKSDMQNQYGTFQDEILSQVAAENASMFDSFAEYKQWMGEAFTTQQSGLDEALAIAAAKSEGLNGTQIDLMNQIAQDMNAQYGDFSSGVGGQLEQMAAENASMFDSLEEYQQWMQDSTAEQKAWMNNEFKNQYAQINNLNDTQTSLMSDIANDMQSQYGDFTSQNGEQLAQMAAENASMFDSLEEYQDWVSDNNEQAAAQAQAVAQAQANNAPAGTVTYSDGSTGSSLSDMQSGSSGSYTSPDSGNVGVTSYGDGQYGFTDTTGEEVGYEDPGVAYGGAPTETGGGDSGGGGGGGSYIATAATNALGKEGLDMFEGWRDYMHTAHPTFTTSYGRYRVTAPKIVSAIDKKENSTELYQDIWNEYLKPIFNLIKKDMDNPKALSDYKVMVRELTNKYLKGDK